MNKIDKFQAFASTEGVRSNLRKASTRAALYTAISGICNLTLRLGSNAILARIIVPEHFGLVMMIMAVTAIADQLRELGLSAATIQRATITHQEVSNLFWVNTGIGFLITLIVSAGSPLVSAFYQEPRLTLLTCIMSLNFALGGLMVQHQALLARQLKLGHTSSIRFVSGLASNLLAIWIAWMGHGIWALMVRELSRTALLALGMWIFCPWVPSLPSRDTNIRSLLSFGANITATNVINTLVSGADRFLLGRNFGPSAVSVYRQAFQLIAAPTDQLLSPLYQVAQPGLSMLQNDARRFQKYYQTVLVLIAAITMPLSLFVAVYAHELTLLLLGPTWMECAPLIMILSLGTFIRQCAGSTALILISRGESKTHLVLTVGYNITLIIGYFIGIKWGVTGIAITEVAVIYLTLGPKLHYSLKHSPVTIGVFFKAIARPAIASSLMAIGLFFAHTPLTHQSNTVTLIIGTVVAVGAFFLLWFILPGGAAEIRNLINQLRSGLKPRLEPSPTTAQVSTGV